MSFVYLPRLKMITNREEIKSSLICSDAKLDEFRHWKLFVRQLKTNLPSEPRRLDSILCIHISLSLLCRRIP